MGDIGLAIKVIGGLIISGIPRFVSITIRGITVFMILVIGYKIASMIDNEVDKSIIPKAGYVLGIMTAMIIWIFLRFV